MGRKPIIRIFHGLEFRLCPRLQLRQYAKMITTAVTTFFLVGLPVGALTYLMIGYAQYTGALGDFSDRKSRSEALKGFKKSTKDSKAKPNLFMRRWLFFGGGFYGMMAVFTYIVLEAQDIWTFLVFLMDPANWTFEITIRLLVKLLINTIMNFVDAALWFTTWLKGLGFSGIVLWLVVVYLCYSMAARLARDHSRSGLGHMQLWPEISERFSKLRNTLSFKRKAS